MAKITSIGDEVDKRIQKQHEDELKEMTIALLGKRGASQKEIDQYLSQCH